MNYGLKLYNSTYSLVLPLERINNMNMNNIQVDAIEEITEITEIKIKQVEKKIP